MAKYFISGAVSEACRIKLFDNVNNDYIGYYDVVAPGTYEIVFSKSTVGDVDVTAETSLGKSESYGNVTPVNDEGKVVNITFPYNVLYGGNAGSYGVVV
jgi:hypothetical protein